MHISDWSSDVCSSDLLVEHDWPGNVRELKNFAYSVVLDLPSDPGRAAMPADAPLAERVRRFEATIIHDTLAQTRGHIAETMARLGRSEERRVGKECVRKCG